VGYQAVLLEPDADRARAAKAAGAVLTESMDGFPPGTADVVVTDHHRPELGVLLRDALAGDARWIGLMGNPRVVEPPHIAPLRSLGVPDAEISRVHRPIGLNIGSRTPAEIAIATLAGLIADRNAKPGGFEF
jgi:xanthine/CO dehydrogenase XdhC/CoxF family maturation factor